MHAQFECVYQTHSTLVKWCTLSFNLPCLGHQDLQGWNYVMQSWTTDRGRDVQQWYVFLSSFVELLIVWQLCFIIQMLLPVFNRTWKSSFWGVLGLHWRESSVKRIWRIQGWSGLQKYVSSLYRLPQCFEMDSNVLPLFPNSWLNWNPLLVQANWRLWDYVPCVYHASFHI